MIQLNGGYKLILPFTDYVGDHIEIFIEPRGNEIVLDDLGHTAGLLFQFGQHSRDAVGHQLIVNLAAAYDIDINYNSGVLFKHIQLQELSKVLNFIKVLTSIKTILPEMRYKKKDRKTGRRLGTLLRREVKQLRLPFYVGRQVEVEGRNETWVVDYKYPIKVDGESVDVMIITADLQWGQPREKAAHVVTLAVDVLDSVGRKDLRIVYDVGRNGNGLATGRAASLIEDFQGKIGYRAYDYSDAEKKSALLSLLHQELSPLSWEKAK